MSFDRLERSLFGDKLVAHEEERRQGLSEDKRLEYDAKSLMLMERKIPDALALSSRRDDDLERLRIEMAIQTKNATRGGVRLMGGR